MGFRMRKSIRIAPGIRLNLSKSGVGISARGGGIGYSVHTSGRRTVSASTGIPGIHYQKSTGGGGSRARRTTSAPETLGVPRKPGLFAPKGEKQLYKAIRAQDVQAIKRVGELHPSFRVAAWSIAGLQLLADAPEEASRLLDAVFARGEDPTDYEFVAKYLYTKLELPIAYGVTATLPVSRDTVGLALAELKQRAGDVEGAIDAVEQLEPTTYAAVSLAELYTLAGRWEDVVKLTEEIVNEDDATALLLCFRGMAFREQGYHDAAHEALKEALRARSRAVEIRHLALSGRATNYPRAGKESHGA